MRSVIGRVFVAALSGLLLMGCAPAATPPTPTPVEVARWQVTPVTAFYTPVPPTATRTATPRPPTATPSPTPKPNEALALLKQVDARRQEVKSSRALVEMQIEGQEHGKPVSATITVESEFAEPNARMKMGMVGGDLPMAFDMEFIIVGDTAYWRMGEEWTAFPGGKNSLKNETNMMDTKEMEELLYGATDAKIVGRRTVKGVECDVVSLTLPYGDMLDLAELGGGGLGSSPSSDIVFDRFDSEVAIGVDDKVVHQMLFHMAGAAKGTPADRFSLVMTVTVWDVNSPNIVIQPPPNVKPFAAPTPARTVSPRTPTRTPTRAPTRTPTPTGGRTQTFVLPTPWAWSYTPMAIATWVPPTPGPLLRR